MRPHLLVFGISLMFTSIGPLFAQGRAPAVDGVPGPSEYATTVNKGGMTVSFTLTPDKIYAACVTPGDGWVSIGLGSTGMSGATMFIGYVDDSGKPAFAVKKWSWFALRDYKGVMLAAPGFSSPVRLAFQHAQALFDNPAGIRQNPVFQLPGVRNGLLRAHPGVRRSDSLL